MISVSGTFINSERSRTVRLPVMTMLSGRFSSWGSWRSLFGLPVWAVGLLGRLTLTAVGVPGVAALALGGLGGRAVERVKLGLLINPDSSDSRSSSSSKRAWVRRLFLPAVLAVLAAFFSSSSSSSQLDFLAMRRGMVGRLSFLGPSAPSNPVSVSISVPSTPDFLVVSVSSSPVAEILAGIPGRTGRFNSTVSRTSLAGSASFGLFPSGLRLRVGFSGLAKLTLRSGLGAFSLSPRSRFSPRGLSLLPAAFLDRGSGRPEALPGRGFGVREGRLGGAIKLGDTSGTNGVSVGVSLTLAD